MGIRGWLRGRGDDGFTMIELVIAMMVLALVMAALAPAYYALLRATGAASHRSVANGIAVAAQEQIRSIPYYEAGYASSAELPPGCPTTHPVILPSGVNAPMASLPQSKSVGNVTYNIQRCVNWVDSTVSGDTLAYKQTVVTVSWAADGLTSTLSQTSALYPGGQGSYSGQANDYVTGTTTATTTGVPPAPPTNVTAVDDASSPSNTIDVSWTNPASLPLPDYYLILYTTTNPLGTSIASLGAGAYTQSPNETGGSLSAPVLLTVGPGTTYYFQVVSVAAGTASTITSNTAVATSTSGAVTTTTTPGPTTTVAGATTTTVPPTTTTVPACAINTLTVTPTVGTNGGGVALTSAGFLVNVSSFSLSVNANSSCQNVAVGYAPSGCVPAQSGCPTTYASLSGSGTLYGTAGTASTVWTVGTQTFTVFVGATPVQYSPLTQQQVILCTQKGNSGKC